MYKPKRIENLDFLNFIVIILFLLHFTSCSTMSDAYHKKTMNPAVIAINFYQNNISPVDGHRCRMYPSCSEYSRQAFLKHGIFKGWIMTSDRLLRCGRNEMSVSSQIVKNGKKYCSDNLENNDFWWYDESSAGENL